MSLFDYGHTSAHLWQPGSLLAMTPLPSSSPYRVDQVMTAPGLMSILFLSNILLAGCIQGISRTAFKRFWWAAAAAMLLLTFIFFSLASWGTSDVTKLSHYFELQRDGGTQGEPFWWLVGPVVRWFPYRMAGVHGLVVCAYAASAIVLARLWNLTAWSGWWALLITCSPMLRSFLQNGISRQALAVLLLLPLFLRLANLLPVQRWLVAVGVLLSAGCHTTFPFSLAMASSPRLTSGRPMLPQWIRTSRWGWLILVLLMAALAGLIPITVQKFATYAAEASFFSHYPVLREVYLLQSAMLLGVLGTCWQRRLSLPHLFGCPLSRLLSLFAVSYIILQVAVEREWLASIAFRLSDGVGFFLLILFLAWLRHYKAAHWLWPALVVTLLYWLVVRVLPSGAINCGQNDEFLCIPDRWPWQVRY
jgi:hypothetical protein